MREKMRRLVAVIMSFMMVWCSMPVSAFAEIVKEASGGISLMSLLPPDGDYATFNFYHENESVPFQTQIVKDGEDLLEPEAQMKNHYKFLGWSTSGSKDNLQKFGKQEVSGTPTYDLHPVFEEVYYVFFHDADQKVYQTKEFVANELIDTSDVKLPVGPTQKVMGWSHDISGIPHISDERINGEDVHLYPDIQEGHWITFVTPDDASYVEPQFVPVTESTKVPSAPTWPGMKFDHWSLIENEAKFEFGGPIDDNITLYACWAKATAKYTVIYWEEAQNWASIKQGDEVVKAAGTEDEKYVYASTKQLEGTVGTETAATDSAPVGFTTVKIEKKTIERDGSTIVNVYRDRNRHTIRFRDHDDIKEYPNLKIEASYGANILQWWPATPVNPENKSWWSVVGDAWQGNMRFMEDEDKVFYERNEGANKLNAYYYTEVLPGESGTTVHVTTDVVSGVQQNRDIYLTVKLHHTDNIMGSNHYNVTDEDRYTIEGFTIAGIKPGSDWRQDQHNGWGYQYNETSFYYKRNQYTIDFVSEGKTIHQNKLLFEQATEGHTYYKPTGADIPLTEMNVPKVFAGWYSDINLTKKATFPTTMPARNIVVYAKWELPTYNALAHLRRLTAQGGSTHTNDRPLKSIPYGMSIAEFRPDYDKWLPTMEEILMEAGVPNAAEVAKDYTLYGWVTKDNEPFNFNEKLYGDVEIYPVYALTGPFTLKYDLNGGKGTAPTDTHLYRGGSSADVKNGTNLEAPNAKDVFLGWSLDKDAKTGEYQPGDKFPFDDENVQKADSEKAITLYAIWGPKPGKTQITYHSNYQGKNGLTDELDQVRKNLDINGQITVEEDTLFPAPDDYKFVEWNTKLDGKGTSFAPGAGARVDTEGNNDLYAIWERKTGCLIITKTIKSEDLESMAEADPATFTFTYAPNNDKPEMGEAKRVTVSFEGENGPGEIYNQSFELPTGTYTVTESFDSTDYEAEGATSTTVEITNGESVQVDFVNIYRNAKLQVIKTATKITHNNVQGVCDGNTSTVDVTSETKENVKAHVGDVITYEITVKNVGKVTLYNVTVTDPKTGLNQNIGMLDVGDTSDTFTVTYTLTSSDVKEGNGMFTNTATAKGFTEPEGGKPVGDLDDEIINIVESKPGLSIVKDKAANAVKHNHTTVGDIDFCGDGESDKAHEGDTITYTITVENTGNVDLENVTVTDDLAAAVIEGGNGNTKTIELLKIGETQSMTVTYEVTRPDVEAGEVKNTATADTPDIPGDPDKTTEQVIVPTDPQPALEVVKSAYGSEADRSNPAADQKTDGYVVDDVIYYKIVVTNTGNVTLKNVRLDDPLVSNLALQDQGINGQLTLAPGDSVTFYASHQVTQDDVDVGTFVNVATAHGTSPKFETKDDVEAHDDATVVTEEPHPAIVVTKTATPAEGLVVGDTVNYSILVKNTGNVTLKPVVVTDILPGLTFVADDNHSYDIVDGKAVINKMAPDAEVTVHATYTIDQDDVDAGEVDNTATATGTHKNTEVTDSSSAAVTTLQNPALEIVKEATVNHTEGNEWCGKATDKEAAHLGDTISYTFTVKNTGNVTLTDVKITDALLGYTDEYPLVPEKTTLAPGESTSVTVENAHTVTADDIAAGSVYNKATATGTDPDGKPTDDDDEETVETDEKKPAMMSTKTLTNSGSGDEVAIQVPGGTKMVKAFKAGETATFDIVVTNTGNVTLHNVTVTEEKTPGARIVEGNGYTLEGGVAKIGDMAPGATVTVKAEYTVSQTDIDNKDGLTNIATADSDDTEPQDPSEEIPEEPRNPALSIVKALTNNGTGEEVTIQVGETVRKVKAFKAGETAEFDIIVTNTGNVTLEDVEVRDTTIGAYIVVLGVQGYGARLEDGHWVAVISELPVRGSVVVKAKYTVTQADIDDPNTLHVNIATATDPDENIKEETHEEFPEEPQHPSILVEKTTEQHEPLPLGTVVNYTITVTNNGNVTLTDVHVTDPKTGLGETIEVMEPGAVETFTTTHTINQADILAGTYVNTATAGGTDPTGQTVNDSDDETVTPADADPRLSLEKEVISQPANGEAYEEGETVSYEVTVTNTGNLTLTDVTVTDILTGDQWVIENLAPGEQAFFYPTYDVQHADTVAGFVKNVVTATATCTDPSKEVEGGYAEVTVDTVYAGNLEIIKTVTSTPAHGERYALGETITYSVTVTNTGRIELHDVVVTDELTGNTWTIPTLPIGASETFNTNPYTVTQADTLVGSVLNVATATGKDPDGNSVTPPPVRVEVPTVYTAHLTVTKTTTSTPANGSAYGLGETITYSIVVTNDSHVTVTDVVVTDPLTGDTWTVGTLEPGQSSDLYTASHVVTEADTLAGHVLNVATATGKDPDDEDVPTDPGEDDEPTVPSAHLTVTKVATSTPANGTAYVLGETITYNVMVTNDSLVTANNVVVTDELTGDEWLVGTLEPGESSQLYTTSYVVTEADTLAGHVLNVATATGKDPDGNDIPTEPGEDDEPTVPSAHLTVTKVTTNEPANGEAYALGETITYNVMVTNDSLVTANNVAVTDPLTGDEWIVGTLEPGESSPLYSASYVVTEADTVAGHVLNVATATGKDPDDNDIPTEPGEDDEPTVPSAHLTLTKVATSTPANGRAYAVGETITYNVTVTNDSQLTVTDVVVTDELTGAQWVVGTMEPGATQTFETSYVVTEEDTLAGHVLNVATATGTDPDGNPVDPDPAEDDEPTIPAAHMTITKTATSTPANGSAYGLGETITYDVTATNDGLADLTNAVVTDELTGDQWTVPTLAVGQSVTFQTSYVVTEADVLAGHVLNVATGTATGPDPEDPDVPVDPGEDDEPTVPVAHLTIIKTATSTPANGETYGLGETITYNVTVVNDSVADVTDVVVTDELTGDQWTVPFLASGDSATFTTSYVVTAADVVTGHVLNVATGTATGPDPENPEVPVEPDDDDEPTVSQAHLSIFKTATSTPANGIAYVAGEIVTYSITALNDGIIELLDVVVTDDLTGSTWTIPSMQPGDSQTFTTTYVVTDADAQAGYVLNVATATATSPDPNNPPTITPDEEIVPAAPTYTLTIQYLYLDGTVAAETYFQDGLVAGMTYDVTSPVIPGFTATQPVVAGTMPAANVLVTVFYAPTPAAGPGGPGLVTLDEYGVPLNIGNLVMNVGDCFE